MPKPKWADLQVKGCIGNGAGSIIYRVQADDGQALACKHVTRATIEHIERARQEQKRNGSPLKLAKSLYQSYFEQVKNEYEVLKEVHAEGKSPHIMEAHELRSIRRRLRFLGYDLLLELVEGKALKDEREYPMPGLIDVFRQAAQALIELHQYGYVHADLKPAHIIVTPDGTVKLIDFGQCTHLDSKATRIQGTPEYMAPEQLKAQRIDFRTDVYGLGATMFWTLTGRLNRPAMTGLPGAEGLDFAVGYAGRAKTVRSENPDVPRDLDELVTACCERRPDKRPRTMREVWETLSDMHKRIAPDES